MHKILANNFTCFSPLVLGKKDKAESNQAEGKKYLTHHMEHISVLTQ